MKITLTFQSDGNEKRYICATWLPVGKHAGADQEVTRHVGTMTRHPVGGMQNLVWTVMFLEAGVQVLIHRETEREARQAVRDYLDRHGPWWFGRTPINVGR